MTDFIFFLGRFHVLLLHLPIGILLLAVVLEVAVRRERWSSLAPAVTFVWLAGAITAIATVVLGLLHATEGGFDADAIAAHRTAGITLAALALLVWLLRSRIDRLYAKVWAGLSAAVVALLVLTGHFGGNLTHGDTYLAQYAPGFVQPMFGVAAEQLSRPKPHDVAAADLYLDVVAPALSQRCGSCHNDGKRKGGLSLATYAALMKGGENGKVITPSDTEHSDLYRRIGLSHEHEDFMPRDGKTPLTPDQTAAIGWWIGNGAPRSAVIATLNPTKEMEATLERALGLGTASAANSDAKSVAASSESGKNVPAPDAEAVAVLESNGFAVRAFATGSPFVTVDFTANRKVTDADIATLAKLGVQIRELNLRDAGVTDAQLKTIAQFENLERLRLELNPVTDIGVANFAALRNLKYLNLYGSKVTDKSIAVLSRLERLSTLYAWQTGISAAGIAQFKREHAGAIVDKGFASERFSAAPKTIPVVN